MPPNLQEPKKELHFKQPFEQSFIGKKNLPPIGNTSADSEGDCPSPVDKRFLSSTLRPVNLRQASNTSTENSGDPPSKERKESVLDDEKLSFLKDFRQGPSLLSNVASPALRAKRHSMVFGVESLPSLPLAPIEPTPDSLDSLYRGEKSLKFFDRKGSSGSFERELSLLEDAIMNSNYPQKKQLQRRIKSDDQALKFPRRTSARDLSVASDIFAPSRQAVYGDRRPTIGARYLVFNSLAEILQAMPHGTTAEVCYAPSQQSSPFGNNGKVIHGTVGCNGEHLVFIPKSAMPAFTIKKRDAHRLRFEKFSPICNVPDHFKWK